MKRALLFALTVSLLSLAPAAPSPGRKTPGPSAIEAARLKNNPPPGYLSHYLPDDRYKIAGGVWKYVSTDLDTYYHVPSSPNMMRQPASNVIGFASARDAEEAGYVRDPADPVMLPPGLLKARQILRDSNEVADYLEKVSLLFHKYESAEKSIVDRANNVVRQTNVDLTLLAGIRPLSREYVGLWQNILREYDKMPYPPTAKNLRSKMRVFVVGGLNATKLLDSGFQSGDIHQINRAVELKNANEINFKNAIERESNKAMDEIIRKKLK